MFGDGKLQELLAATGRLAAEVEALRQRCARLEAQLQAQDLQALRERCERLSETLRGQDIQIAQLRTDNRTLSERLDEEVRQAQRTSTALFERIELARRR